LNLLEKGKREGSTLERDWGTFQDKLKMKGGRIALGKSARRGRRGENVKASQRRAGKTVRPATKSDALQPLTYMERVSFLKKGRRSA